MKTKEELEERISKVLKAGEQYDYDREDNLLPVYNYAEVKDNIVFLADEYAKQQAIAFLKHAVNKRGGFIITFDDPGIPENADLDKKYSQFIESLNK